MNRESRDQIILQHYQKLARNFGPAENCSMKDPYIRQTEIDFFMGGIQDFIQQTGRMPRILDIGCGNGHLLAQLQQQFPHCLLMGVEFTPELWEVAQQRKLPGVHFLLSDCRREDFILRVQRALAENFKTSGPIDIVITERVIINILHKKEQRQALLNIAGLLAVGGKYLLAESFTELWQKLNKARREFNLTELPQSPHNLYLNNGAMLFLQQRGGMQEVSTSAWPSNYLSTHFYLTRILHQALRPAGTRVRQSEFVQFFAQALPPGIGEYSPILLRVFEKIQMPKIHQDISDEGTLADETPLPDPDPEEISP